MPPARLRVLLDYRPALRERSGVGEYTHELARALRGEVDLTLFSSSWKDRLASGADLNGTRIVDRRVPVALLNFAWHRLGWPPAETLAGGRFDVTHSPHPLLLPTRRAARVVTIHDLNFMLHPERTRGEIRRDYPALARRHAHRADRIVAVSEFTAGEIVRLLDVPRERISICSPGAPSWRPRPAPPPGGGYILFFGTLEPRKNLPGLLDAFCDVVSRRKAFPELVLAGKRTDASDEWFDRISRPPLAGRVRYVGYVEPAGRRQLYDGARMLVQPSFEEGFGITVLEAMTLGLPVVASNRGALPEVLDGSGITVDPEDVAALAAAIERMVDDPALAARCSEKGLQRARFYAWTRTAREVLSAYAKAIDAHRG